MKEKEVILLTGASGFVGRAILAALEQRYSIRVALRNPDSVSPRSCLDVREAFIQPGQDWAGIVEGISGIVHCAARVHVMREHAADALSEFRVVNVEGTLCLARQAAQSGVRRFVFISSIGVNGGETHGEPFTIDGEVAPHTPYAVSKSEAETELRRLASESGMEVVIVRPPLVYGPNAPGNFSSLMKWLTSGVPLPLGGVTRNKRSFVYLENLVDLIVTCIDHPAAANKTFLVSDDEDLSTAELLRRMGSALGRPARLLPVPPGLLSMAASLIGKPGIAQRLCGSLQVDISHTKDVLGWRPPFSVDEGLKRTAEAYLASRKVA